VRRVINPAAPRRHLVSRRRYWQGYFLTVQLMRWFPAARRAHRHITPVTGDLGIRVCEPSDHSNGGSYQSGDHRYQDNAHTAADVLHTMTLTITAGASSPYSIGTLYQGFPLHEYSHFAKKMD
jgi:hypothetical protein